MRFVLLDTADYMPQANRRDSVAILQSLIKSVCCSLYNKKILTILQIRSSTIQQTAFASTLQRLDIPPYELLCDIETCWSSTYFMIERALLLQGVSFIY
jgi:hypothetical protein